jgi:hypothetical protein
MSEPKTGLALLRRSPQRSKLMKSKRTSRKGFGAKFAALGIILMLSILITSVTLP